MAGSIAVTYTKAGEGITRARVDWLSDAAGAVSVSTFDLPFCELLQVAYTPVGANCGNAKGGLIDLYVREL